MMKASYQSYSKFRRFVPPLALVAVLVWDSHFAQVAPKGPDIDHFDKVAHFCVFGLLATLWLRWVGGQVLTWLSLVMAVILTLLYGGCDELLQSMNPVRSADGMDWLADGLGAVTAVMMYRFWAWYRELLETPISRVWRTSP